VSVVPEARAVGRHVACARRREGTDEARERRLTEQERLKASQKGHVPEVLCFLKLHARVVRVVVSILQHFSYNCIACLTTPTEPMRPRSVHAALICDGLGPTIVAGVRGSR